MYDKDYRRIVLVYGDISITLKRAIASALQQPGAERKYGKAPPGAGTVGLLEDSDGERRDRGRGNAVLR